LAIGHANQPGDKLPLTPESRRRLAQPFKAEPLRSTSAIVLFRSQILHHSYRGGFTMPTTLIPYLPVLPVAKQHTQVPGYYRILGDLKLTALCDGYIDLDNRNRGRHGGHSNAFFDEIFLSTQATAYKPSTPTDQYRQ
jgi:hypothetical protein